MAKWLASWVGPTYARTPISTLAAASVIVDALVREVLPLACAQAADLRALPRLDTAEALATAYRALEELDARRAFRTRALGSARRAVELLTAIVTIRSEPVWFVSLFAEGAALHMAFGRSVMEGAPREEVVAILQQALRTPWSVA
jgi:hypothetical protein